MALKSKGKKGPPSSLQQQLSELEEKAASQGIHIHYDRLEAAGLKLKDGACKVNGEVHIFVDKRKPTAEKVEILAEYVEQALPD